MAEIIQTKTAEPNGSFGKTSLPLITIIISYILCVFMFFFFGNYDRIFRYDSYLEYKVGDIVTEDIYSDSDLYLINELATDRKREFAESLALPVFRIYDDITDEVLSDFENFRTEVNLFKETDPVDINIFDFTDGFDQLMSKESLFSFLESPHIDEILNWTEQVLQIFMNRGVVFTDDTSIIPPSGIVEVWRESGDEIDKTLLKYNQMPQIDTLPEQIENELSDKNLSESIIKTVTAFTMYYVRENCFSDEFQTRLNRDLAASKVKPVELYLAKGEKILEKGLVITPDTASKLESIKKASGTGSSLSYFSPVVFALFLYAFAFIYLRTFSPERIKKSKNEIIIYSSLTLAILLSYVIYLFIQPPGGLSSVIYIPVALFSMLVSLLTHKKSGLIFQLILTLALYYISGFDLEFLILPLVYGVTGTLVIEGATRRIDIIRAGMIQGTAQAFFFLLYTVIRSPGLYDLVWGSVIMFSNGFISSILALGLLPVLENWLKTSTRFRLIELSDSNAPVLKNMLAKAPGTYIHSMNVANLAEMACQEIGANTLLARVGGLYHDIGKMDQSEYFIENQTDVNKHDDMKPSLSAAVLKSHVKIGIEKAHDLNLPNDVIDIIAQHHATSTMKYFYDRAMKEKGNTKVNKDDFSYSGPNPQTREAAIVMLADTIEAATRTLKKPSLAKLEKYVWELIMEKFINGELNDCSLTFRDMEFVKSSFVHVLAGHFHTRIEYPDDQKNSKENDVRNE